MINFLNMVCNAICNIVLIILASSITGGIFTIVWHILKTKFAKYLRTDIIYFTLKCVLVSYFIPSILLITRYKTYNVWGENYYYGFFTTFMRIVFCFLFAVMIALFAYVARKKLKRYKAFKAGLKYRFWAKLWENNISKELLEQKKIKKRFEVYHTGTLSPFIMGFFKPTIYIPLKEWESETLRIALNHELNHYKQRDNIWIPIANIIVCLNWFNPLAWYASNQLKIWSEVCCDYKCIIKDGTPSEKYFITMYSMSGNMFQEYSAFVSSAAENKMKTLKRAEIYVKYSKKAVNKIIVAVIMLFALAVSGATVYAATGVSELIFGKMFEISSKEYEEYDVVCDDGVVEHVQKMNDKNESIKAVDAVVYENTFKFNSGNEGYTLVETIKQKECKNVALVSIEENNMKLQIAATTENKESLIDIGIIEPDGTKRYVEGCRMVIHSFSIDNKGDYKVFVINNGDTDVELNISILGIK